MNQRILTSFFAFVLIALFIVTPLATPIVASEQLESQQTIFQKITSFPQWVYTTFFVKETQAQFTEVPVTVQTTDIGQTPDALSLLKDRVTILENTKPIVQDLSRPDGTNVNLIRNSTFEAFKDCTPNQWRYQLDSNNGNTCVTPEAIRTGSYGFKFAGSGSGNFGLSEPNVKLLENRAYTYSSYVKIVNAPKITVRLSLWDEISNAYAVTKSFTFSGTKDWSKISFTFDNRDRWQGKQWFPMIEVYGLTSGAVYLDDASLYEGTVEPLYHINDGGSTKDVYSVLGDGAIIAGSDGTLMPTQNGVGSLGNMTNKWKSLRLVNSEIDENGNLSLAGGASITGQLSTHGQVIMYLPDNIPSALDIQQGTDDYININTTNNTEEVTIGNTSVNPIVTISSGTGTINVGNGNQARAINIGTGTGVDTIKIGTGGTGADSISIGDSAAAVAMRGSTLTLGNAADANVSITDNNWNITAAGAANFVSIGATTPGSGVFTTLSSTGVTTLGNNTATVAINSNDWDITTVGNMTGIGSITMDGNFSQTGATTFSTGTGAISLNGATTVANGRLFTANGNAVFGNAATDTVSFTSVLNSDLTFIKELNRTIKVDTSTTAGAVGANLTLKAGNGTAGGANNGGDLILSAGAPGAGGTRGAVVPSGNGADDLGKSSNRWGSIFANTVNFLTSLTGSSGTPTVDFSTVSAGNFSLGNNAVTDAMVVDTLTINGGTITNTSGAFTSLSSTGVTTLGNNTATVAIDSIGWDMSTVGALSGIASLVSAVNASALPINIDVSGTDASIHTLSLQIDGNSGIVISATGDGTGGVGARSIQIGDASANVSLTDSDWNITGAGSATFSTLSVGPNSTIQPSGAGSLTMLSSGANALTLDTGAGSTLSLGDTNATTLSLGAGGALTRLVNIGTGTGIDTINIGTGGTAADIITIGDINAQVSLADDNWSIANTGIATFAGLTSTGAVDFNSASSLRIPVGVGLASGCAVGTDIGNVYYANTTAGSMVSGHMYVCSDDINHDATNGDFGWLQLSP